MVRLTNLRAKIRRAWAAFRDPMSVAVTVPTQSPAPVGPGQSRFVVERTVSGSTFALYDGPSGSEARQWFEHVKSHNEPGSMRFLHDGVVRSTYSHPTEP